MMLDYLTLDSQSHILIEIENTVKEIMEYSEKLPLFNSYPKSHIRFNHRFYLNIQELLPRYLLIYRPDYEYDYSEHIQAFWNGCFEAGLLCDHDELYTDHIAQRFRFGMSNILRLVEVIKYETQTKQFRRRCNDRRYQAKQNREQLEQHILNGLDRYARAHVVRVDLKYRKEAHNLINIDQVYLDLERFKRHISLNNGVFTHLINYAWCLEQGGKEGGYHFHTAYYFKASEHQSDWHLGQRIGELWEDITQRQHLDDIGEVITQRQGTFHNCNTAENKKRLKARGKLGIGYVTRRDALDPFVNAIGYLALPDKDDQYLRMKPKGRRTFGKGSR